jgi:hypothetical protein
MAKLPGRKCTVNVCPQCLLWVGRLVDGVSAATSAARAKSVADVKT